MEQTNKQYAYTRSIFRRFWFILPVFHMEEGVFPFLNSERVHIR